MYNYNQLIRQNMKKQNKPQQIVEQKSKSPSQIWRIHSDSGNNGILYHLLDNKFNVKKIMNKLTCNYDLSKKYSKEMIVKQLQTIGEFSKQDIIQMKDVQLESQDSLEYSVTMQKGISLKTLMAISSNDTSKQMHSLKVIKLLQIILVLNNLNSKNYYHNNLTESKIILVDRLVKLSDLKYFYHADHDLSQLIGTFQFCPIQKLKELVDGFSINKYKDAYCLGCIASRIFPNKDSYSLDGEINKQVAIIHILIDKLKSQSCSLQDITKTNQFTQLFEKYKHIDMKPINIKLKSIINIIIQQQEELINLQSNSEVNQVLKVIANLAEQNQYQCRVINHIKQYIHNIAEKIVAKVTGNPNKIAQIFSKGDTNGDKAISRSQFQKIIQPFKPKQINKQISLTTVFCYLASDPNQLFNPSKLVNCKNLKLKTNQLMRIFQESGTLQLNKIAKIRQIMNLKNWPKQVNVAAKHTIKQKIQSQFSEWLGVWKQIDNGSNSTVHYLPNEKNYLKKMNKMFNEYRLMKHYNKDNYILWLQDRGLLTQDAIIRYKYVGYGEDNLNRYFIIMERMDMDIWIFRNISIYDKSQTMKMLKINIFLQFIRKVCLIHNQEYIHNDIKQGNILIKNGQIKLGDCENLYHSQKELQQFLGKQQNSANFNNSRLKLVFENSKKNDTYSIGVVSHLLFQNQHPFGFSDLIYPQKINSSIDQIKQIIEMMQKNKKQHISFVELANQEDIQHLIKLMLSRQYQLTDIMATQQFIRLQNRVKNMSVDLLSNKYNQILNQFNQYENNRLRSDQNYRHQNDCMKELVYKIIVKQYHERVVTKIKKQIISIAINIKNQCYNNPNQIAKMFDKADKNHDKVISFEEFKNIVAPFIPKDNKNHQNQIKILQIFLYLATSHLPDYDPLKGIKGLPIKNISLGVDKIIKMFDGVMSKEEKNKFKKKMQFKKWMENDKQNRKDVGNQLNPI